MKQKAVLRQSIISPYNEDPDENVEGLKVFTPSSPMENIATRLSTNKQLQYLEEVTNAIEQVYNELPDDYRYLVLAVGTGRKIVIQPGMLLLRKCILVNDRIYAEEMRLS